VDPLRLLVIDNFDSFVFNLVHYCIELRAEVEIVRNDALTAHEAIARQPDAVLISPGPGTPDGAGISLDMAAACVDAKMPLLGVCLGHQVIGQHFGSRVARGGLMHGKTAPVEHDGSGVFAGLPSPFTATRYHSLIVEPPTGELIVNATDSAGSVMGVRHPVLPIHGVQFHPESIATEHGHALIGNFLNLARAARPTR